MSRMTPEAAVLADVRTWLRVPGMLCTAAVFTVLDDSLVARSATVDVPLEGRSLDEAATRLLEVVHGVPGPVGVMGQSLGAIVAMAALASQPGAVAAAVLMSTNARAPRPEQRRAWLESAQEVRAGRFGAVVDDVVPTMFAPGVTSPTLLGAARQMAEETGPQRFLDQLELQASRVDLRPLLPRVRSRLLVIAGGRDQLCPRQRHEEIAAAVPQARLEVIEHAGHLLTLEDPLAVSRVLGARPSERTSA